MAKEEPIKLMGRIIQTHPRGLFEVQVVDEETGEDRDGTVVKAEISGKIRMHHIKLLLGDVVDIEVSPYDLTRGRIVYRHK